MFTPVKFGRISLKGLRWEVLDSLLVGLLVTAGLYWVSSLHRDEERREAVERAAQPVFTQLTVALKTIEDQLRALCLLWAASNNVEPAEWEVAVRLLKRKDIPGWEIVAVFDPSANSPVEPGFPVGSQRSPCGSCQVLYASLNADGDERTFQEFLRRVCVQVCVARHRDRLLLCENGRLLIGVRVPMARDVADLKRTPWVLAVTDVQQLLARIMIGCGQSGRLELRESGREVACVTTGVDRSLLTTNEGPTTAARDISYNGAILHAVFTPGKVSRQWTAEWLPTISLLLGILLTVVTTLWVSSSKRYRWRLLRLRSRLLGRLTDSEKRYPTVFSSVHQPLLITDETWRIYESNPAAEALFGQALAGRSLCEFCPKHCPRRGTSENACFWRGSPETADVTSWVVEGQILTADKTIREVAATISRVELGRGPMFVVAIHDMTAQKMAQRKLEESAKSLQAANVRLRAYSQEIENSARAKITMLAGMSHEIRTPLSAILGYARLLSEKLSEHFSQRDDEGKPSATHESATKHGTKPRPMDAGACESAETLAVEEVADGLVRNSEHLLEMINTMLDFSKLESGQIDLEQIPTNPVVLADDVIKMLGGKARQKNLSIGLEVRGKIPRTILTDPTRLRQILINLTDNAIKFTKEGRVWIEIELDNKVGPSPMLEFRVCDTGVGMSPDQIGRLFQPFRQGDRNVYRHYGGTGLGLVISRQLARLLGGDIWVESTPGKGTIFHVRVSTGSLEGVPLVDANEALAHRESPRGPEGRKPLPNAPLGSTPPSSQTALTGRVLLVEDFADNRRLIHHYLEKAGLLVETVENGREALEAYERAKRQGRPFDLILMDIEMPVMDGVTAVRELRARGCSEPILALTAHTDAKFVEQFSEAGFSGYVPKPIHREELLEVVTKFLAKRFSDTHSQGPRGETNWMLPRYARRPWETKSAYDLAHF